MTLLQRGTRAGAICLLGLALGGCAGQWMGRSDPRGTVAKHGDRTLRLVLVGGDTVVVDDAYLRRDSIVAGDAAYAVGDVKEIATWHSSGERSAAAVVMTTLGAALAGAAVGFYLLMSM